MLTIAAVLLGLRILWTVIGIPAVIIYSNYFDPSPDWGNLGLLAVAISPELGIWLLLNQ